MQSTRNARRTAFSAALAAAMASVSALPATAGHGYKQTNSPAAAQSGSDRADRVEGTGVAQWMVKPGPSSWATAGAAPTEIAGPAEATVFRAFWEPLSPLPGTSNIAWKSSHGSRVPAQVLSP